MSEFVYQFVKGMTMREKAYFKRFSKMFGEQSEKNYLKLFDSLQKMEEYDLEKLKSKFKNQSIENNWSSEVNYLQGQLLKSMANFHLESSIKMKLQKSVLYIELLIERDFQKQALKLVKKAKKLAYKIEDFSTILKLVQLEEEILFRVGIIGFTKKLAELQSERKMNTEKINNLNQLRLLREQIREFQFSEMATTDKKTFNYYFQNKLIEKRENALSKKAKENWLYIKSMQAFLLKDLKGSQALDFETVQFLETNDSIFKNSKLLVAISNYLYSSALLGDTLGFEKVIEKLKEKEKNPKFNQIHIAFIRYARSIDLYFITNDLEGTQRIIEETIPFLKEKGRLLGETQFNYLHILSIRSCILLKKHELGIELVNQIIKAGIMKNLLISIHLFLLILYFELDWKEMILLEVESSYKLFKRQKVQNELSKVVLKFFKSSIKSPHRLKLHFQKLITKLEEIEGNPKLKNELKFFNYLEWAKEKSILL